VLAVRATDAEWVAKQNAATAHQAQEEALADRNAAVAAREQQATNQYISDMQLLPLAFDKGTSAEVNKLLDSHLPKPGEPDRRGFEWHYWNRQQNPQVLTDQLPDCEPSRNSSWAVSDNGRRIGRISGPATADDLPLLTIWDQATRRVVLKHRLPVRPPADTPDVSPPSRHPRSSAQTGAGWWSNGATARGLVFNRAVWSARRPERIAGRRPAPSGH
jgi:hypothetical protein